jgi:gamma-glutamyl-gamma-aminobutyrate hydrolase PuuD
LTDIVSGKVIINTENDVTEVKEPAPKVLVIGADPPVALMFLKAGWELAHPDEGGEVDLICFCGGDDVSPKYYNEIPHARTYSDPNRDKIEHAVFKKYESFPKVGICRGGQFLNVMSGGGMWQDVNKHGLVGSHDMIDLMSGALIPVTSTHHQMMIAGDDGEVLGIAHEASRFEAGPGVIRDAPDYDTEVVWYESTNSLCVQGHPEYSSATDEFVDYFFGLIGMFWGLTGKER